MKAFLISALTFGAATAVALAEPGKVSDSQAPAQQADVLAGPVALTQAQMDTVTAGVQTGTVKWFNPTRGYGFIQSKTKQIGER